MAKASQVSQLNVFPDEWIKVMEYIYTVEYYAALKRKALLTHSMDKPRGHQAESNKPFTKTDCVLLI